MELQISIPGKWVTQALCAQVDPELFFPASGGAQDVENAKAICGNCTVRTQCLQRANENREEYGVWGGMSVTEREQAA